MIVGDVTAAAPQILRPTAMFFDVFDLFADGATPDSRFTLRLQAVAAIHAPKWRPGGNRWRQFALKKQCADNALAGTWRQKRRSLYLAFGPNHTASRSFPSRKQKNDYARDKDSDRPKKQ